MRNKEYKTKKLFDLIKNFPYFTFNNLLNIEEDKHYLKIFVYRYIKSGKLIRLKKGLYVTIDYFEQLEKEGKISSYTEFISNILYEPSYISLDYVLYENNLLTEIPVNFTLITTKKTTSFSNYFGTFIYHNIKKDLFFGYEILKEGEFLIYKAKKSKALFDFLYLRKNEILNKDMFDELRLNLDELSKKDKDELKKFVELENSKKMKEILSYII